MKKQNIVVRTRNEAEPSVAIKMALEANITRIEGVLDFSNERFVSLSDEINRNLDHISNQISSLNNNYHIATMVNSNTMPDLDQAWVLEWKFSLFKLLLSVFIFS